MPAASSPCVLVVADPGRVAELASALGDSLALAGVELVISAGGDDSVELFAAKKPRVVVVTASLQQGDTAALIDALRELAPRDELIIVMVGDGEEGPIRTANDAIEIGPDRFVVRPLEAGELRAAVGSALDMVARALASSTNGASMSGQNDVPLEVLLAKAPLEEAERHTQPMVSRGSGPIREMNAAEPTRGELADDRPPTQPRVSSLVETTDVPAIARSATRALVAGNGASEVAASDERSVDETAAKPTFAIVAGASEPDGLAGAAEDASEHFGLAVALAAARSDGGEHQGAALTQRGDNERNGSTTAGAGGEPEGSAENRAIDSDRHDADAESRVIDGTDAQHADSAGSPAIGAQASGGALAAASGANDSAPIDVVVARATTDRGTGVPPVETPVAPAASGSDPNVSRTSTDRGTGITRATPADELATRAALRARWEALADSIGDDELDDRDEDDELDDRDDDDAPPLPPVEIAPRRKGTTNPEFQPVPPITPWRPGTSHELHEEPSLEPPRREPTLILHDTPHPATTLPEVTPLAEEAAPVSRWSQPVLLSELIDRSRDSSLELLANVAGADEVSGVDARDERRVAPPVLPPPPEPAPSAGRDFARQLREKMSKMAQRLFHSDENSAPPPSVDVRPRHDHHTEIDLALLAEEPALGPVAAELEHVSEPHEPTTSPGSWDTQVRERGLPDSGEIVRGVSDVAMVLARMSALSFTGRVGFRRDEVEKVVFFDQGRPVFAASNEPGDRMGELLVREGKITAAQYERCQSHVAQSGRRIGEILVDFGYLKRRELLPAVRRHVEDILYSLFGWDRGHYHVTTDASPSAERIRLSRHPASLVLEGIRRKFGRTTLERLLGPASTVIEVPDRDRLGGVLNSGDLSNEERAALAAFDGQADLAQVARAIGVDVADVLPLAWGLCVLGLATARRSEHDVLEESTALVGETDLAIDRERVRARWQLVGESDYFALLGVRRNATAFEIRRAYQSARRDFAADCFPVDLRRELARELEDIASVLDEAFRVLRDDRLRQSYLANLIE